MDKQHYLEFVNKYGDFASWAIWEEVGLTPKSNMDNMNVFDLNKNPKLLETLNPNVIMVGLNISKRIEKPLSNFHGAIGGAYKIRHAFWDTPFYGAYMTDIIKDFEQKISGTVSKYLRANKDFERQNILLFEQELVDLKSNNPLIIAFGKDSYDILNRYFSGKFKIIKVSHYSNYASKENYRAEIENIMINQY
jgi:hypothetical protein